MGECYCSNITIMQLFHELKQQFPALPDHIVSQCIAQNSHDKETCARSLRVTQESRPSPGAFPPRAQPQKEAIAKVAKRPVEDEPPRGMTSRSHATSLNGVNRSRIPNGNPAQIRAHRPASLDIGRAFGARQCPRSPNGRPRGSGTNSREPGSRVNNPAPSSAPPTFFPARGFFEDFATPSPAKQNIKVAVEATTSTNQTATTNTKDISDSLIGLENQSRNRANQPAGFELNVNVACSPAGNHDFRIVPKIGTPKRTDLVLEPRAHYADARIAQSSKPINLINHRKSPDPTRSYTSVSLTLRPPSSDPQPPIDIRSQGSSLTYSTSSLDPRGFQSRLQISIGPGSVGSVASARIRPPMGLPRPNSLVPHHQTSQQRPPGLPAGPPSQLPRPTTTTSAPTTPSAPVTNLVQPISLPTTPSTHSAISSPPSGSPTRDPSQVKTDLNSLPSNPAAEHQSVIIAEQLLRKERLEKELKAEKGRLEAMKRELQTLTKPVESTGSLVEEIKRKLVSEIYQLRLECDRLADEVDKRSDPRVPLGETNEEFYQGIYTGQPYALNDNYVGGGVARRSPEPPPLPSRPPVWQTPSPRINQHHNNVENRREEPSNEDWDERDGPSWVCRMCTFDNHPLMDKCEQCDMPRLLVRDTGETQDIHIRVTHHHNFNSPRRTVHSWVV
ncbi:TGF-beta-activated kinase 1 and MAP3K7-binding protein 3-like isoform X2 [Venturia canescens]|uniref:TGF-beta-activated kinase 1 and MAP3K7-binding protein 3-like isoform X2 n=1 Tax=Venturia canescens TaxID=32260 RepID=UPI001C9C84D9|nr:TGF-beta-activated kinase 1 and MAP3K7-binding protein 3-like isoform X2 [Venturia canescens]